MAAGKQGRRLASRRPAATTQTAGNRRFISKNPCQFAQSVSECLCDPPRSPRLCVCRSVLIRSAGRT